VNSRQGNAPLGQAGPVLMGRWSIPCSPETLSDLVGQIYDCVLDPAKWESVLKSICDEFAFASSILGVQRLPALQPICQYSVGVEPDWLARIPEFGAEIVEVWGGLERFQGYPLDEPLVNSQVVDRAVISGNRYVKEWTSRGMLDAVAMFIARDESILGSVAFNRHQSVGAIGDREVDALRILAPHFRRAVTISNLFDMKTIEAATFGSVLDSFAFGIILVDEGLGIVHANQAAAVMLRSRDVIRSDKAKLSLPDRSANAALERAVRQAASDESNLGGMGIGIPVRRAEGEACVIHVFPVKGGTNRRGLAQRAAAALFIAPAAAPRMPIDALALLYDLTPTETRIFEMISAGNTQSEIGQTLGIAPSTVKTHVLHLFDKTGCRRQADLLKLAASVSGPA
jgi:DNA-binding CsgD family transcriptional regulator